MWCQNVVPMWCHCGFHVVVNVVPRGRHHIGTAGSTWHHDAQRCVVCFFTKSRENAQLACPPSVFCRESRTRCMRALQKGSILAPPRPHADQKKPNRTERQSGDPAKNLFRAKKCRTDVREIAKSGVFQAQFPLGCRFAVVSALAGRAIVSLQRCTGLSRLGVGERLVWAH